MIYRPKGLVVHRLGNLFVFQKMADLAEIEHGRTVKIIL